MLSDLVVLCVADLRHRGGSGAECVSEGCVAQVGAALHRQVPGSASQRLHFVLERRAGVQRTHPQEQVTASHVCQSGISFLAELNLLKVTSKNCLGAGQKVMNHS